MASFLKEALLLIFPQSCLLCQKPGAFLCDDCRPRLSFIASEHCPVCGVPFISSSTCHLCVNCFSNPPHYDKHRSLLVYDNVSKTLIHDLKYRAGFWLCDFFDIHIKTIASSLFTPAEIQSIDCVLPVPLHNSKLASRGYNQSLLLAKRWARFLNKPLLTNVLWRQQSTMPQTGMNRKGRIHNLKDAFGLKNTDLCYGRIVLLVDDVHTTGTTLNEAAKVLKRAGVNSVYATTLAMALWK